MEDLATAIRAILDDADEVIIAKVETVDFYEKFERDGRRFVYFGTEESFRLWRLKQCDA